VTRIFNNGQPSHGIDRKIFEVMTSTLPKGTLGSVASLLAATLYQGSPDRNHKLWTIVSSDNAQSRNITQLSPCQNYDKLMPNSSLVGTNLMLANDMQLNFTM
jgi:hypothetical protein